MRLCHLLFLLIVLSANALAHAGLHEQNEIASLESISYCVALPTQKERNDCYSHICLPDYDCAESLIASATKHASPEIAIMVLDDLMEGTALPKETDGHLLGHVIGYTMVETMGISGEVFLNCPIEYNYGCLHGFFETALGEANSPIDAAINICESIPSSWPDKWKFYCYHGTGHGIMMSTANNVEESLRVCDKFPDELSAEACSEGIFMENAHAEIRGEASKGTFNPNDPLAPCNKISGEYKYIDKYEYRCYENQATYLIELYNYSLIKASNTCLYASKENIPPCIIGFGLMTTAPQWQSFLAGHQSLSRVAETGFRLCNEIPEDYRLDCIIAGIHNLLNYDEFEHADRLCSLLRDYKDKVKCYRTIGQDLNFLVSEEKKLEICMSVPDEFRKICFGDQEAYAVSHLYQIKSKIMDFIKKLLLFEVEIFFDANSANNIQVRDVCRKGDNLDRHKCLLDVGNALMESLGYDTNVALEKCGILPQEAQDSCAMGVFMQSPANNYDPHYPCNLVNEKYKGVCYFLQTPKMLKLFSWNFSIVVQECKNAPESYHRACFEGLGREVSWVNAQGPEKIVSMCKALLEGSFYDYCIFGALGDILWSKGYESGMAFCSLLEEENREICYSRIAERSDS